MNDGTLVRLDPRPAATVGRDDLLAELATRLAAGPAPGEVALCGLGGVGKTTAALEYAYQHLDEYELVWMFHAEEATGLARQFHELAELLDPSGAPERADPVARVHRALDRGPGRWLLLFDNVRDHSAMRGWLPPTGAGHVLVTSQDGHWPADQAIPVDALTRKDGAQFLLNQTGGDDLAAAEAIAEELGGLPLALAQAAGYVTATGQSLAEYGQLLREHRTSTLATWRLAFDDLTASSAASIVLLRLLSCLAPENVPVRLLLGGRRRSPRPPRAVRAQIKRLTTRPSALDDAVAGLRRYSLISAPDSVVSVHRLVQAATLNDLPPDQRTVWKQAAAALVEAAIPADPTIRINWPVYAQLLPHALAVLDPCGPAMQRLANAIGNSGDHATARTVWHIIHDAHHAALGAEHPRTLNAHADVGYWTGMAGDAEGARKLFVELLPIRERVSGRTHPHTLKARANLAFWTGEAGDPGQARDLYSELLPLYERWYFLNRPATLSARASLAHWTGKAGDVMRARDLYAELLPTRERVSGPEHPHTLNARGNLAGLTGEAGQPERARDLFAELLPIRERVSGPEHPNTLSTRASFARWVGEAGDPERAWDLFAELLPIRERVSGPEHPHTLHTRSNLARWIGEAGDPAQARDMFAQLIPTYERVFGPEHPQTSKARDHLDYWTWFASSTAAS